jgi:hypothetical protein
MTPPQYPYFPPPYPVGPAFPQVQPPKRRSQLEIVITLVISALAVGAACVSFSYSLFWAMGFDACSTADPPRCNPPLGWAFLVTWGGIAVAIVIAVSGMVVAAVRGRVMWIWPTVALGLIVVGTVIGFEILATASK